MVSKKKIEESLLQKKEDIEPNAVLPEVTDPIIPEKKPKGRPRKLKVDVPKAKALLAAGWSYEKIARSEFHCSVEELKNVLEESKSHQYHAKYMLPVVTVLGACAVAIIGCRIIII